MTTTVEMGCLIIYFSIRKKNTQEKKIYSGTCRIRHKKGPGDLSNPSHKGTRDMCWIVQDIRILGF